MSKVRVVSYGEVLLSQDILDHLGVTTGDTISSEKLSGARVVLAKGKPADRSLVETDGGFPQGCSAQSHDLQAPSIVSASSAATKPSGEGHLKWYFCYNQASTAWFSDMIKVAVTSAKTNTRLLPNCVYDGEPTPLTVWLKDQGVQIHQSQVPFQKRLFDDDVMERNKGTGYRPESAKGFYLPLQIPVVEEADEHVLYTDCDVMFLRDPDLAQIRPTSIAAVPEVADLSAPSPARVLNGFNSGVMVINVPAMRNRLPDLMRMLDENGYFNFVDTGATYDQGLLNLGFKSEWGTLPPIYNWRVFYGVNPDASVVHWHGPKPAHVIDLLGFKQARREKRRLEGPIMDMLLTNHIASYEYYFEVYCQFLDKIASQHHRVGVLA
jgi:hypothetical protein